MRVLSAALFLPLVLGGCLAPSSAPAPGAGLLLQGRVKGGEQPIAGSHVYLFAASTLGYGKPSISLLNAASTGFADSLGAYVLTDVAGGFSISGDYQCTPNTQVYLYALGGDPGAGTNTASGQMAVLGNCPNTMNFQSATPFITMNEVSTVAAAYAMAGFATDATHVASSGTPLAQIGIQNAFANSGNLANLATATALATTPAGNGTVPQAEINTLANILATCVNSNGTVTGPPTPTSCYTLFSSATADGTSTGTQPTETATAAINIAHHPSASAVVALYTLPPPASPFAAPGYSRPNDFTIGLNFTGGGISLAATPNSPPFEGDIAIDGAGNAWIANSTNTVTELSSLGVALSGTSGFTGGGLTYPIGIAIDGSGNAWIANGSGLVNGVPDNGRVAELSSTGTAISPSGGFTANGGVASPSGIAIDGTGNVWVTNNATNSITVLSSAGTTVAGLNGITGGGLRGPAGIAIGNAEDAWIANNTSGANSVTRVSSTGTLVSGANGYTGLNTPRGIATDRSGLTWVTDQSGTASVTVINSVGMPFSYRGGGLATPYGIALDGAGYAWISNYISTGSVVELTGSGSPLSGTSGLQGGAMSYPQGITVDGSGDVWVANQGSNSVTELIGAATPVVTPLATAVKNATLGMTP